MLLHVDHSHRYIIFYFMNYHNLLLHSAIGGRLGLFPVLTVCAVLWCAVLYLSRGKRVHASVGRVSRSRIAGCAYVQMWQILSHRFPAWSHRFALTPAVASPALRVFSLLALLVGVWYHLTVLSVGLPHMVNEVEHFLHVDWTFGFFFFWIGCSNLLLIYQLALCPFDWDLCS